MLCRYLKFDYANQQNGVGDDGLKGGRALQPWGLRLYDGGTLSHCLYLSVMMTMMTMTTTMQLCVSLSQRLLGSLGDLMIASSSVRNFGSIRSRLSMWEGVGVHAVSNSTPPGGFNPNIYYFHYHKIRYSFWSSDLLSRKNVSGVGGSARNQGSVGPLSCCPLTSILIIHHIFPDDKINSDGNQTQLSIPNGR